VIEPRNEASGGGSSTNCTPSAIAFVQPLSGSRFSTRRTPHSEPRTTISAWTSSAHVSGGGTNLRTRSGGTSGSSVEFHCEDMQPRAGSGRSRHASHAPIGVPKPSRWSSGSKNPTASPPGGQATPGPTQRVRSPAERAGVSPISRGPGAAPSCCGAPACCRAASPKAGIRAASRPGTRVHFIRRGTEERTERRRCMLRLAGRSGACGLGVPRVSRDPRDRSADPRGTQTRSRACKPRMAEEGWSGGWKGSELPGLREDHEPPTGPSRCRATA
jgi:hypothetical protein